MTCEQTTRDGKPCAKPNGHLGPCAAAQPEPPKGRKHKRPDSDSESDDAA